MYSIFNIYACIYVGIGASTCINNFATVKKYHENNGK